MEPNLVVVPKKIWSVVRVMYHMLKKGILSKRKLFVDLNMMMKRGKILGKAIHNLMVHHHRLIWSSSISNRHSIDRHASVGPHEYEFSCSNTPSFPFNFRKNKTHSHFFACAHAPSTDDDFVTVSAVKRVLERLNSEVSSPALPGFGRTPMVRQLRITDSPFPLADVDENSHLDEAAEKFILKFYNDLRQQNNMLGA